MATMSFTPTPESLLPGLSLRQQMVLLARTLWREGYDDHLAGHITINLHDGTLLCNPWPMLWNEFRADDVIRIDLDGRRVDGEWAVPPGIPLHLELHKARPGVEVAVHNHPLHGTVWADMGEVPPAYDQSSVLGGGKVAIVAEYDGTVDDPSSAAKAVAAMGDADMVLLAGHGVFVLGNSVRAVHQRAVALEQRCQRAWYVRAAGGPKKSPLPTWYLDRMQASSGDRFIGFWEAMARQELRADPSLFDGPLTHARLVVSPHDVVVERRDVAGLTRSTPVAHGAVDATGECDVDALWPVVERVARSLSDVTSISIGTTDDGVVMLDANGSVLRRALLASDPRSADDAKWCQKKFEPSWWLDNVGIVPEAPQFVTKLSWLHRSEPEKWTACARFVGLADFLRARLLGGGPDAFVTPRSVAAETALWCPKRGRYHADVLSLVDGGRDWTSALSKVVDDGAEVGRWNGLAVRA